MRSAGLFLVCVPAVAVAFAAATRAGEIGIENASNDVFYFSFRKQGESAWSRSIEVAPQQDHQLTASGPVTSIS